ncbi:unnamed protein product [Clonostachys chloroleuca]|uniref:FAD-binding PCMH-type domain-containing protein n=1 Tax=Clonostachys chloroleuca TaxID=1926264 RepID=A0AA35QG25_9HYPO|nr:unnamed protein product [Clonostachys chloroleuca]
MTSLNTNGLPIVWKDGEDQAQRDLYERHRNRTACSNRSNRYPLAVVRPKTIEHIVQAVKLAQEHGARIAVRGGGHSFSAWSVRDNSILIDMVDYRRLNYNETTQILEVSPSITGSQIVPYLKQFGRFAPTGHCPSVGVGGFALQGGMGIHANGVGYICEYVEAVDVVTAAGDVLHCDKDNNEELYWAARFHIRTIERFKSTTAFVYMYPIKEYDAVMPWLLKSPNTEIIVSFDNRDASPMYSILCYFGVSGESDDEVGAELQRWRDWAPPGAWQTIGPLPEGFEYLYKMVGEEDYTGKDTGPRFTGLNMFLRDDCDMLEVCRESFTTLPRGTWAYWEPMAPHSNKKIDDMAFTMNYDRYVAIYTHHLRKEDDEYFDKWLKKQMEPLLPYSYGAYLGDACFTRQPTKYWSDEAYARLMRIRRKWDPSGRICGYLTKGDVPGENDLTNKLAEPVSVFPRKSL